MRYYIDHDDPETQVVLQLQAQKLRRHIVRKVTEDNIDRATFDVYAEILRSLDK